MKTANWNEKIQTLKLYPSGEVIGNIKYDTTLMPHGGLGTVPLGSIPSDLYDLEPGYAGIDKDQLVYSD